MKKLPTLNKNRKSVTKSIGSSIISVCEAVNDTVDMYSNTVAYANTLLTEVNLEARVEAISNLVNNYGYTQAEAEAFINTSKS